MYIWIYFMYSYIHPYIRNTSKYTYLKYILYIYNRYAIVWIYKECQSFTQDTSTLMSVLRPLHLKISSCSHVSTAAQGKLSMEPLQLEKASWHLQAHRKAQLVLPPAAPNVPRVLNQHSPLRLRSGAVGLCKCNLQDRHQP